MIHRRDRKVCATVEVVPPLHYNRAMPCHEPAAQAGQVCVIPAVRE
jgi:hypothetical protein